MRTVELSTAGGLMLLSGYFMWYAVELPIGWDPASGPGGGAFPFWLSLGMLICAAAVFVKNLRQVEIPTMVRTVFVHREAQGQMALTVGSMLVTTLMVPILGSYIAIPAFLVGYTRIVGHSSWRLSILLALGTVLFMWFFFEVTLKILLPKGVTEPLFIPLYAMFF